MFHPFQLFVFRQAHSNYTCAVSLFVAYNPNGFAGTHNLNLDSQLYYLKTNLNIYEKMTLTL